jgi:hypothetical protein
MTWEAEVRYARARAREVYDPGCEMRKWRRRCWLSAAANILLFVTLLLATHR